MTLGAVKATLCSAAQGQTSVYRSPHIAFLCPRYVFYHVLVQVREHALQGPVTESAPPLQATRHLALTRRRPCALSRVRDAPQQLPHWPAALQRLQHLVVDFAVSR
jgi:hypothetical protein